MGLRRPGATFLLVTWFYYLAQYVYAPFLTPYVGVLGGSLAMTGLVAGSYGALQFVFRLPLGLWSDRHQRRKPFVLAGAFLAAVSALGMASSRTPVGLLIYRSLSGVAAATWVIFTVFYAGLFPPEEAGKRMGLLTFAASGGQWAGNLIGGALAEHWGWTAPFWGAAVPGLFALLLAALIPETLGGSAEEAGLPGPSLRQCARAGVVEPSLLALISHFVFYATILGFTPVYVMSLGLSKFTLGILSTAGGAAYVAGTLLTTRPEVQRLPWRRWVGGSFAAMAAAVWATPRLETAAQLLAVFLVLGVCRGTTYPVFLAAVLRESKPRYAATAMGLFQATYAIGMFAGPALAGVVAQRWGLASVFPFTALLALAGLAWCSLPQPKSHPEEVTV